MDLHSKGYRANEAVYIVNPKADIGSRMISIVLYRLKLLDYQND